MKKLSELRVKCELLHGTCDAIDMSVLRAWLGELKEFIIEGMQEDGGMHKQWFLGEILLKLGFTKEELIKKMKEMDYDYEDWGVPP